MPKPTTSVEASVPTSAKLATGQRKRLRSDKSTCSAPANSSKDNMPCINTPEKSMRLMKVSSACRKPWSSPSASSPITPSDSTNAITITPVSSAVATRQMATASRKVRVIEFR